MIYTPRGEDVAVTVPLATGPVLRVAEIWGWVSRSWAGSPQAEGVEAALRLHGVTDPLHIDIYMMCFAIIRQIEQRVAKEKEGNKQDGPKIQGQ